MIFITAVSPNSGLNTNTSFPVSISGSGFQVGAVVAFINNATNQPIQVFNIVVNVSGVQISCNLNIANLLPSGYTVIVTNPDATVATLSQGFEVTQSNQTLGSLTPNEQTMVNNVRQVLPEQFSLGVNDATVLAYINLVLGDFNVFPPFSSFDVDSIVGNPQVLAIITFGACFFANLFQQMNAGLQDFTFSDQGFTVQIDQVSKLQASITNMGEVYKQMVKKFKYTTILDQGPLGLSSPRYQSQLGQFLKVALGSAFTWGTP